MFFTLFSKRILVTKVSFKTRPVTLSTPADSSRRGLSAEVLNVAVRSLKRLQNLILLFIFCIFFESFEKYFPDFAIYLKIDADSDFDTLIYDL